MLLRSSSPSGARPPPPGARGRRQHPSWARPGSRGSKTRSGLATRQNSVFPAAPPPGSRAARGCRRTRPRPRTGSISAPRPSKRCGFGAPTGDAESLRASSSDVAPPARSSSTSTAPSSGFASPLFARRWATRRTRQVRPRDRESLSNPEWERGADALKRAAHADLRSQSLLLSSRRGPAQVSSRAVAPLRSWATDSPGGRLVGRRIALSRRSSVLCRLRADGLVYRRGVGGRLVRARQAHCMAHSRPALAAPFPHRQLNALRPLRLVRWPAAPSGAIR